MKWPSEKAIIDSYVALAAGLGPADEKREARAFLGEGRSVDDALRLSRGAN